MSRLNLLVAVFPRRLDREYDLLDYEGRIFVRGAFAGSVENEGNLIWLECQTG